MGITTRILQPRAQHENKGVLAPVGQNSATRSGQRALSSSSGALIHQERFGLAVDHTFVDNDFSNVFLRKVRCTLTSNNAFSRIERKATGPGLALHGPLCYRS